jgi:hypothetical protein
VIDNPTLFRARVIYIAFSAEVIDNLAGIKRQMNLGVLQARRFYGVVERGTLDARRDA